MLSIIIKLCVGVWRGLKASVQCSEDQDTAGVELHGQVIGWWVIICRKHGQRVGVLLMRG